MIKSWYDEVKEDFVKNINDTYTLNLAVSILEDRQNLLDETLKYKEVINRAIEYINSNPNVYYDEHLIDVETLKANEMTDKVIGEVKFISKLLSILKEVEHEYLANKAYDI